MKRMIQCLSLSVLFLSLSSCGLPGAALRSVGRAASAVGGLVPAAAAAAAL